MELASVHKSPSSSSTSSEAGGSSRRGSSVSVVAPETVITPWELEPFWAELSPELNPAWRRKALEEVQEKEEWRQRDIEALREMVQGKQYDISLMK